MTAGHASVRPWESLGADPDRAAARLDDLARLVPDWIWEVDRELRLTYAGPRAMEVVGRHPAQLVGRPITEILGTATPLVAGADGGRARPVRDRELEVADGAGETRVVRLSALPVFDPDDETFQGYRGLARDVTAEKRWARELAEAKAAAEAANRAKGEFLATMTHEFRTPLNAVIGFAEVMEGEHFGPLGTAKYRDYAGDIANSARHLAQLVDDVLDAAKLEAGRHELHEERVHPAEIVERAVRIVRGRAEEGGVDLRVNAPGDGLELWADGRKLVQILVNLLANAVKFTERGGQVEVVGRRSRDGGYTFAVADTGAGMSPADQELALAPFGQVRDGTSARERGTGLGLPLAKVFTGLHGGAFTIASAPGVGTRITVALPARRVAASP